MNKFKKTAELGDEDSSKFLEIKLPMERFGDFAKVVNTLSVEEFVEQFPHPIFLFSEKPGDLSGFMHTQLVDAVQGVPAIDRFSSRLKDFFVLLPSAKTSKSFPQKAFIGRDSRRDFQIAHLTVSNRHACILQDESQTEWRLADSGSTNGTQVRGKRLTAGEPMTIHDGDVITFGKVNFLFFSPRGAYRFMKQYLMFQAALRK